MKVCSCGRFRNGTTPESRKRAGRPTALPMTFTRLPVYPDTGMPRFASTPFAFPEFRGATRRLVLWNLAAYFALALALVAAPAAADGLARSFAFTPGTFLHGALWQPFTYSFIHTGIGGTLLELLSLFFIAGFLDRKSVV